MTSLNILGGVALILFGMRFLRKGIDRLFGHRFIPWLKQMTSNRIKTFFAGLILSMGAPSSTALSVLSGQMVKSGDMTAERMFALLLGTNIGITITVQLLAFNMHQHAAIPLLLGVICYQFLKKDNVRGFGQCLIGLGLILTAIHMISSEAKEMRNSHDLISLIEILTDHPWILMIMATVLTFFMQSSTVMIGLGISLTYGNILSLETLVTIILGTNLGIALTGIIANWSSLDGKRLGLSNFIVKLIWIMPLVAFLPFTYQFVENLPGTIQQQAANFHTLFNIAVAILALPLVPQFYKLSSFLIQQTESMTTSPQEIPLAKHHSFLDSQDVSNPHLALAQGTQGIMNLAEEVHRMTQNFWQAFQTRDLNLIQAIKNHDDQVDDIYKSLQKYLSQIHDEDLKPNELNWHFALLTYSNELEAVGDIIDGTLCNQLSRLIDKGITLTEKETQELSNFYKRLNERMEIAFSLLTSHDFDMAQELLKGKEPLNNWSRDIQKQHYSQLQGADSKTIESNAFFIEFLNGFRKINSHITAIGYSVRK